MPDLKKVFITGAGGLVGSAVADLAIERGLSVTGVESDARGRWFGAGGSVQWRLAELEARGVQVVRDDFRDHTGLVKDVDVIVHCAGQPSHDYSRQFPILDSAVNFNGTLELLEATRQLNPDAIFIFTSTNKVYGDSVNHLKYEKRGFRYEPITFRIGVTEDGVSEDLSLDDTLHTPFGVSKTAADLMVQEYRRTFGLHTTVFRCGCLTGPTGSAVELHGFLGYLVKCAVMGKPYTIYGYGGFQVRDNLAASDLAEAILAYAEHPKGAVYNMGGGRENSVSILEVLNYLHRHGHDLEVKHGPERLGDHQFWITDTKRFERDYPQWRRQTTVYDVINDIMKKEISRG